MTARKIHPQKNTLLKNAQANATSNFCKKVFFSLPQKEILIIFFSTLQFFNYLFFQHTVRNRTDIAASVNRFVASVCKLDPTVLRTDRKATDNSTYRKLAVQWLNEALYSCRQAGRMKFCGGRQFCASKSLTFHILTVTSNPKTTMTIWIITRTFHFLTLTTF
jgi:hypothetical protein